MPTAEDAHKQFMAANVKAKLALAQAIEEAAEDAVDGGCGTIGDLALAFTNLPMPHGMTGMDIPPEQRRVAQAAGAARAALANAIAEAASDADETASQCIKTMAQAIAVLLDAAPPHGLAPRRAHHH